MSVGDSDNDQEAWKSKYYESIGELERREGEWKRLESLLRDAMVRMCVALEGLDGSLDDKLGRLRRGLRSGTVTADLAALSRDVTETLDRLDAAAPEPQPRPAAKAERSRRGLGRWLRRGARPEPQPATPSRPSAAVGVSEALLQLLERLDLPAELEGARESLQQRLEARDADGEWPHLLACVADLISRARSQLQREKREIEEFLAQLTERLSAFDTYLQGLDTDRSESLDSGRRLDQAVQEQVRGLHTSVRDAADLDSLKNVVQQRLEAIGKHMQTFRQAEEERNTQAEQRIQELNERMRSLERESGELRDRIREERRLALIDGLTGVPNRLAYEERVAQEFARWKRFGEPLSVVLMDIDNFKVVNDTYGHKAGDKVLKTIGQLLASKLRATDFLARYGGEEFVVLMPGADAENATRVADKLREEVRSCGFHYRGNDVEISISCGIAAVTGDDQPDDTFERADQAMYRAKEQGRNRCVTDGVS